MVMDDEFNGVVSHALYLIRYERGTTKRPAQRKAEEYLELSEKAKGIKFGHKWRVSALPVLRKAMTE